MDFFKDTLLDYIIPDLRPIIKEYLRTYPLFVIGKYSVDYPDYKMIEARDIKNKFMESFVKYYRENKGLPSIDNFNGATLCFCDGIFIFQSRYIRCTDSDYYSEYDSKFIKSGNIIPFRTGACNIKTFIKKIYEKEIDANYDTRSFYRIGLYIRDNIFF